MDAGVEQEPYSRPPDTDATALAGSPLRPSLFTILQYTMSETDIAKRLNDVLLDDGDMCAELFEGELMDNLPGFRTSMEQDGDEFMFVLTEHYGDIAMVLIEPEGKTYINADARKRLKELWPFAYESNMKSMIPGFAEDLGRGEFSMMGVKTER
jgi:hypothetical protein